MRTSRLLALVPVLKDYHHLYRVVQSIHIPHLGIIQHYLNPIKAFGIGEFNPSRELIRPSKK